jgi:hypothetical protein
VNSAGAELLIMHSAINASAGIPVSSEADSNAFSKVSIIEVFLFSGRWIVFNILVLSIQVKVIRVVNILLYFKSPR